MAGHDDARSSVGQGRWGADEDDREDDRDHHRMHHRRECHHRERDERRPRHQVNIMEFVRIGPPTLTGEETPDIAEVWIDRMEQCFRIL